VSDLSDIVIVCDCLPCHDWMAFASWYSLGKRLPDSKVSLECRHCHLFAWARRLGVPIKSSAQGFRISPTVMAVRDFEEDESISPSKGEVQTCLVDYSCGCGNFVVADWINNSKVPFLNAVKRFGNGSLTVNEMAILNVWEQCHNLYLHAGGQ
jgi:hypothetical protein